MLGYPIAPLSGVAAAAARGEVARYKENRSFVRAGFKVISLFFKKKIPISQLSELSNELNRKSPRLSRFQTPIIRHRQKVDRVFAGLLD